MTLKKSLLVLGLGISLMSSAWADKPKTDVSSESLKDKLDVRGLTEAYVSFLNKVGEGVDLSAVSPFWSPQCIKIANGKTEYQDGSKFLPQLKDVRKLAGTWKVTLKDLIVGAGGNMSAIRYFLKSENLGNFEVSALLTFNDQGLLTEVNEVFAVAP